MWVAEIPEQAFDSLQVKVGRVVGTGLSLEVGEGQQLRNCSLIFAGSAGHGLRLSLSMGLNVTIAVAE